MRLLFLKLPLLQPPGLAQSESCFPAGAFTHDSVEGMGGARREDLPFSNTFVYSLRNLYMHTMYFSHIYPPFPSRTRLMSHSQLCSPFLFKPIDLCMDGCGTINQRVAGNPNRDHPKETGSPALRSCRLSTAMREGSSAPSLSMLEC